MKKENDIRISFNEEARNDAKIKVIGVGGGGEQRGQPHDRFRHGRHRIRGGQHRPAGSAHVARCP